MTFNELEIGKVFRALRNDIVGKGPVARIVRNDSSYIKVGHNVSVDVRTGKDCIFRLDMPVKPIDTAANVDVRSMQSYKICNVGAR